MNRVTPSALRTVVAAAALLLAAGAGPAAARPAAAGAPALGGTHSRRLQVIVRTDDLWTGTAFDSARDSAQPDLVAVDNASRSPSRGSSTLGFAIVDDPVRSVDDLAVAGRVDDAWLGVTAGNTPAEDLRPLGVGIQSGALVHEVFDGSPAQRAGIRPGDVVTRVDGRRTYGSIDLVRTVDGLRPGSLARFTLVRDGREITLAVRLDPRPDDQGITVPTARDWPGFTVAEPRSRTVIVASVDQGGPAASGLREGDVISGVNGSRVRSLEDFYGLLNLPGPGPVVLALQRDGRGKVAILERQQTGFAAVGPAQSPSAGA
jgi:S1-C subfamily serine protease